MLGGLVYLTSTFGAACPSSTFFGLKPWWYYLRTEMVTIDPNLPPQCKVYFDILPSGARSGQSDILLVLLAVVDDLLMIAGLVAIGFVIWGGVLYMTSQGSPEQTQKGQATVTNALIGLVLCVMAIAIVRFVGARVG